MVVRVGDVAIPDTLAIGPDHGASESYPLRAPESAAVRLIVRLEEMWCCGTL